MLSLEEGVDGDEVDVGVRVLAFLLRLGELSFSSFWLPLSSAGPLDAADKRLFFRGGFRTELESSIYWNTSHSLPSFSCALLI